MQPLGWATIWLTTATAALLPHKSEFFGLAKKAQWLDVLAASGFSHGAQKPLGHGDGAHNSHNGGDLVKMREQNSELCDAGSRQWTGSIEVGEGKSMFFWYFESRNDPDNAPVLLWMSGGPGATGEFGLFLDSGPCRVNDDGNSTSRAEYSWNENSNVIYIDQPVGIGFSQVNDPSASPTNLHGGARDLYNFLSIFANEAFPHLADRPWHITGESMGGHYTTYYTKYMLEQEEERRHLGLTPRLPFRIDSIVAVDAYIDSSRQSVGYYEFFCLPSADNGNKPLMNETACSEMAAAVPECERLGAACRDTYDVTQCIHSAEVCEGTVGKYFLEGVKPGGWNPYDSRKKCISPPLCTPMDRGATLDFLNREWVQDRLGFTEHLNFSLIDFELNQRWSDDAQIFLPTTRELTWLLDETKVRILFINGNNDIIINTPGQIRMLNEQPWHEQAKFRAESLKDWYHEGGKLHRDGPLSGKRKGGQWKGSERLKLFTVDEAGHMAPFENAEAVQAVLDSWIAI
ncbi:Carboxypeptidase Y [Paramyrothecium foliicola]|nr:Carboxypeptidase Y [Paramyrothecium foliicola]